MHLAHRLAWLYMAAIWPAGVIDHHNHIKTDNRLDNLRACSQAENSRNSVSHRDAISSLKGVTPKAGKYMARICTNRKNIHLGYYPTPEEAAFAYNKAAKKLHGDFARLNGAN